MDLYSLKELHLQYNLIDELDERSFARIPSLRFVMRTRLGLCAQTLISPFLILYRHLNMSYNLLRTLPRSGFQGLDSLETIDLSFNDLREVDERAFHNLPWLATLKVRIYSCLQNMENCHIFRPFYNS